MDTAKLYVDTNKNMLDSESLVAAARVLTALAENQDDITFSGDEHGHYFLIPADLLDKFRAAVGDTAEAKPKRKYTRKAAAAEAEALEPVADAVEALSVVDEEVLTADDVDPDTEE